MLSAYTTYGAGMHTFRPIVAPQDIAGQDFQLLAPLVS